jgi:hypothetical protein
MCRRSYGVITFAMEVMAMEVEVLDIGISDIDAFL